MLTGFDHVTIVVAELSSSLARCEALLGRAAFWRGEHPELGTESALLSLDNSVLELSAPKPRASDPEGLADGLRELLDRTGGGLHALAFLTDDADACSAALRARGVRATKPQPGEARGSDGTIRRYRTVEFSPTTTRGLAVLAVERPSPLGSASAQPTAPSHAHALDHVVLRTADTDAARTLYGEQLGIRLALEREMFGTRMLFFRIGGVTLEVVGDHSAAERDALWGLALRVRDLDAAHARLHAAGFALSDPKEGRKPGTRVFTVRDGTCNVPTLVLHDAARG